MKAVLILLAVLTLAALSPAPPVATAEAATQAKKPFVLKGTSYLPPRRRAYANLRKSHTIETRKFTDPALGRTAQGEPFDNGFFFDTPRGPFGGYTPYMH